MGKNLFNTSSTCPYNTVNFGPLAAEIGLGVWGTPANFNGFRVLAALLHDTLVVGVSQTLRRWTDGATYIRQVGHHVGHWPRVHENVLERIYCRVYRKHEFTSPLERSINIEGCTSRADVHIGPALRDVQQSQCGCIYDPRVSRKFNQLFSD